MTATNGTEKYIALSDPTEENLQQLNTIISTLNEEIQILKKWDFINKHRAEFKRQYRDIAINIKRQIHKNLDLSK